MGSALNLPGGSRIGPEKHCRGCRRSPARPPEMASEPARGPAAAGLSHQATLWLSEAKVGTAGRQALPPEPLHRWRRHRTLASAGPDPCLPCCPPSLPCCAGRGAVRQAGHALPPGWSAAAGRVAALPAGARPRYTLSSRCTPHRSTRLIHPFPADLPPAAEGQVLEHTDGAQAGGVCCLAPGGLRLSGDGCGSPGRV